MNPHCKSVLDHISRLEGQLARLKRDIEKNECAETVTRLALSATRSFDTLRAKIVEGYIETRLLKNKSTSPKILKDLDSLYKLIRA